jgi:hypothetical protein
MISHQHRTIFVHIPKCAGQSIEMAFLTDIGLAWETRAPLLLRLNDQPKIGPPRLAHLIAADYVRYSYVSQELFDAYFRFAVVRDPWSRAVSLYKHLNMNMPFRTFVLDWLPDQFKKRDGRGLFWFLRPQADFVMEEGRCLVSEIVRFEHLKKDFRRIAKSSKLASSLGHMNSSGSRVIVAQPRSLLSHWSLKLRKEQRDRHEVWSDFYDATTTKVIGQLYAADAAEFDYQPPRPRQEEVEVLRY